MGLRVIQRVWELRAHRGGCVYHCWVGPVQKCRAAFTLLSSRIPGLRLWGTVGGAVTVYHCWRWPRHGATGGAELSARWSRGILRIREGLEEHSALGVPGEWA